MSEDMTFCTNDKCPVWQCERHQGRIRQHWMPHSYADFTDCIWWGKEKKENREELDFDVIAKIDKAYDDGYEAGYLQGMHDWGDLDE